MNHYEVFGVRQSASAEEIKKAYRMKIRDHQNETDPEMFMFIRAIYEILMDPAKRKSYDEGLALGESRLNLLETLESTIEKGSRELDWQDVERLLPFSEESERVAAVVLQASYFLDRTDEAIHLAKRLEQQDKLTIPLREYYAYHLRSVQKFDEAIRQFKLIVFEQNEQVLDTLLSYGRLLMQARKYHESKVRFEKWMLVHQEKRMIVWKEWMDATIFFGRREDYELPLLWLKNRFNEEEGVRAREFLTGMCIRAEEYERHDSIQILLDECAEWIQLDGVDTDYLEAIRELGGVREEMETAYQAKNIPLEFFYPVYTYIKEIKGTSEPDENHIEDFMALEWWLNEEELNRAYVMKFKLLYPKTYQYLKREYDLCFEQVKWR
ncbi:J domain-containing protein [Exiguobacterium marinum]|uniref:J domain-containing protein n=1 Tax=Exiguobacterium marinum TaxID=273528 RepID=A0ABY7WWU2_9BACL|nr:J domain-containing protein [Exiguobacterium marinum]WDH75351.1 J domain-containing protein [Exiguobacterium marinum]